MQVNPIAAAVMQAADPGTYEEHVNTVEEWLNSVSYEYTGEYIPREFAIEFVDFIKLVNGGEGEENKTPVLHLKMLDQISNGERRVANMVFRGAAKTTVMGEYLFLYLGVYGVLPGFGKIELALYVSDSIDNGVKNMRKNLEFRYDNSEFLQKYIPVASFTDIRWKFTNIDGNVFIVKGYGAKTGVRGSKEMGKRPRLAVLDDLISDEDARSPTVIASVEDTVYKAIDYALHPERNMIIWSGTPFNAKDPLYKAVESGAWKVNVYPVCEKFPCTREEFRGAWPDRFTYDYVSQKYTAALKAGKVDTFNQELMLRIMSDEDRLVLNDELRWYDRGTFMKNRHTFNFYITTDFANSQKKAGDFSVITVWAVNHKGDFYWADGICARQDMGKNFDDLFTMCQKWKPLGVGIEVSGQQEGYIPLLQRQMMERNIYFNMVSDNNSLKPGIRPTTNKLERFMVVVPLFKLGRFYFPAKMEQHDWMKEFMMEIGLAAPSGFRSKHDDVLDTVSMTALMKVIQPSESVEMTYNPGSNIWEADDHNEPQGNWQGSYIV